MEDRELLELAAKAIGYEFQFNLANAGQLFKEGEYVKFWNPLTDDGDALRLAVKVGINFQNESKACWVKWPLELSLNGTIHYEPHNTDPYAATRRAIVRAAAEIGRAI